MVQRFSTLLSWWEALVTCRTGRHCAGEMAERFIYGSAGRESDSGPDWSI